MKVIIATLKSWNIERAEQLKRALQDRHDIMIIKSKGELQLETIRTFEPEFIFFPHWSYIIPADVYENYRCIVFHMTDLPYGRGGSPLQNLIVRGHKETKISAIRVVKELDAGPVFMKEPLSLDGSAEKIYERASNIIFDKMIPAFLTGNLEETPQEGEVTEFKRRTPEQSELKVDFSIEQIYDYIRMLDAEGYPNAFINFGDFRMTFTDATLDDGMVTAKVVFRKVDT